MYEFELDHRKFTFAFQPIVQVDSQGQPFRIISHEMLLREVATGRFPNQFFHEQLESEEKTVALYRCYSEIISCYLRNNEGNHINLNIDPRQCFLRGTSCFLDQLKPFSRRITIELTEEPIAEGVCSTEYLDELQAVITHIHQKGFLVALDDVGTGENTIELADKLAEKVDFLKFSMVHFKKIAKKESIEILRKWRLFSEKKEIPLVIEGIERKIEGDTLASLGYTIQQGYYWNDQERFGNLN